MDWSTPTTKPLPTRPQVASQAPACTARTTALRASLPVRAVLRGTSDAPQHGESLPGALRAHYEQRLHRDLSPVRIHAHATEIGSSQLAVSHGWHIHFAPGQWQPGTLPGQRLLAHELVHVAQQTSPDTTVAFSDVAAEQQARQVSQEMERGATAARIGARPFGVTAGATPASQTPPANVVAGADVERLVQAIRQVVIDTQLPGVDLAEVAKVLLALRDYGNAGKVVWGQPDGDALGQYDHITDTIVLSSAQFDINNPGPKAAVTIFHEASHTLRWRTTGPAADAAMAAEAGAGTNLEDVYRATINRELKLYREEALAYEVGQGVMYSYWAQLGTVTRERAAALIASADPTTGSSAEASLTRIGTLAQEFQDRTGRDVAFDRLLKDAKAWAASGQNMPEFRQYISP